MILLPAFYASALLIGCLQARMIFLPVFMSALLIGCLQARMIFLPVFMSALLIGCLQARMIFLPVFMSALLIGCLQASLILTPGFYALPAILPSQRVAPNGQHATGYTQGIPSAVVGYTIAIYCMLDHCRHV